MEQFSEEWKNVPYDKQYEVSSLGRVRRKDNKKLLRGEILTPSGRIRVHLSTGRWHQVDHMVATVFVGSLSTGHKVVHKNGNNSDNSVDNLSIVKSGVEKQCLVSFCDRKSKGQTLCNAHYMQKRSGKPFTPVRKMSPRGSGAINDDGYRVHYRPDHPNAMAGGKITEHRLVMSDFLGRALREGENVHHVNGDRLDNRIENLELWVSFQPSGQRAVDLLTWAEYIVETYRETPEVLTLPTLNETKGAREDD